LTTTSESSRASNVTNAPLRPEPDASRLPAVIDVPRQVPYAANGRSKLALK
jgi:hypothetical protein